MKILNITSVATKSISVNFTLIQHSYDDIKKYVGHGNPRVDPQWDKDWDGVSTGAREKGQPRISPKSAWYNSLNDLIIGVMKREIDDDDGERFWMEGTTIHYYQVPNGLFVPILFR